MEENNCINCGAKATIQHHVIPKSLGGVGTVPLCDKCHNLIHEKKAHVLSLKELIKRAFDKKRIPELYAIHFGIEEILKEYGSSHNIQTLKKRYEEISQDKEYFGILFGDYDKERKEGMLGNINQQEIEPSLKETLKKIYGSM